MPVAVQSVQSSYGYLFYVCFENKNNKNLYTCNQKQTAQGAQEICGSPVRFLIMHRNSSTALLACFKAHQFPVLYFYHWLLRKAPQREIRLVGRVL